MPPVMESSRPISESAFMRARSASPTVARWPVHHDRDDKWPAGTPNPMPVAGVVQRPVTEQLYSDFTPAALCHCVAFFYRRERRGADDGHPVAPAPNACCASVSPASATFHQQRWFSPGTVRARLSPRQALRLNKNGARFDDIDAVFYNSVTSRCAASSDE